MDIRGIIEVLVVATVVAGGSDGGGGGDATAVVDTTAAVGDDVAVTGGVDMLLARDNAAIAEGRGPWLTAY